MSKLKLLAAASLVALTTSTAFAGDLELFGVDSTNVVAATSGGTSNGRAAPVMKTNDFAIFTQQAVGNAVVEANLTISDSNQSTYSSTQNADASTTVTETGIGGTTGAGVTAAGNTITGYTDITRNTVTNLLTIQNSATNASASFTANDLATKNFGGTARTAATALTASPNLTLNGENLVAQQVLADAGTTATLTVTDIITTNTNTVNVATGASALINLHQ